jgi:hypothetical protein
MKKGNLGHRKIMAKMACHVAVADNQVGALFGIHRL